MPVAYKLPEVSQEKIGKSYFPSPAGQLVYPEKNLWHADKVQYPVRGIYVPGYVIFNEPRNFI